MKLENVDRVGIAANLRFRIALLNSVINHVVRLDIVRESRL